ncbi:MAG: MoaD/ThiS family protein [Acidimicrobiia bacterium]|nr:MoaD/ThiS family protein [Acidimicrobiia bacterium]
MATLRLFANLREMAGTSTVEIDGATVGSVLDTATDRFGAGFAAGVHIANVWVNGTQADRNTAVGEHDEVAVIPPVSGGVTTFEDGDVTPALLGIILLATFAIANVISVEALAFAAVGGTLAWLWDLGDTQAEDGRAVPVIGALVGAAASGNGAYAWGVPGLAGGLVVGLMAVLAHALYDGRLRTLPALSSGMLMTLTAGAGAGGLVLARAHSPVNLTVFLVLVVLAAVAQWVARRFLPDIGGLDPNLAIAAGVLVGAIAAGLVADTLSPAEALVAGAATVAGLLAGKALGSMLRRGDVAHTTRSPGLLTAVDGAVLAAATFWVGVLLFD